MILGNIIEAFYQPSKREVEEAARMLHENIKSHELKIPETFWSRWIIPRQYLPETAKNVRGKTAKKALEMLVERGRAEKRVDIDLRGYNTMECIRQDIYSTDQNAEYEVLREISQSGLYIPQKAIIPNGFREEHIPEPLRKFSGTKLRGVLENLLDIEALKVMPKHDPKSKREMGFQYTVTELGKYALEKMEEANIRNGR